MATEFAPEQLQLDGDISDSRKRPLEGDVESGIPKRTNIGGNDDNKYILKMLIPSAAAGSVIGKGGQTVVQLQRETGANIKLSKSNDYYPGTSERVVLITGTVESLTAVGNFVIEKVRDSPQLAAKTGNESAVSQERARQVKIIIPNSTAGLIIGKGGATIKAFMEQTGSKLQISQKSEGVNLSERVLTISGEGDANKKAMNAVISKVQEDPQSGSCNNISYAAVSGPIANASPTGSPFAEAGGLVNVKQPQMSLHTGPTAGMPTMGVGIPTLSGLSPTSAARVISAGASYPGGDAAAINAAMNTLASYGYNINALGSMVGSGTSHLLTTLGSSAAAAPLPSSILGPYQAAHAAAAAAAASASAAAANGASPPLRNGAGAGYEAATAVNGGTGLTMPTEGALPAFGALGSFGSLGSLATFGSGTELSKDAAKDSTLEIEVPETLVGAILGKGGKTLVEFQQCSGARIQISKKGEYVPGTRNRKVIITGNNLATQTAHYLVTQRITQEEQNRALKGTN
ncbi:NOVA-like protein [Saccoglossus kowalevskii]|uniref:NOVA-like protein n=1 Tax=Saccoglossus kowalevskii TaxID=10224 RepID=D1LX96_SACKO|nr:NOVA-like protein [Saccoglossus kowalevskii]ACY92602.1 NOVA-like protein [Saccoglossus kowalevskii]